MSAVAFGRTVRLATERASSRSDFRIGLEAIEKETGRLNFDPDVQYDGDGIRFRRGDVLFGKLRPNLRKAWLADADGDAVGDFHVYRPLPERMTSRYLSYLVLSEPFLEPVIASVSGAKMPRADWNEVRNVKVWVPSLSEQRAIAHYLDRETAQIDTFIAKSEELIDLLTERRAVAINDLVWSGASAGTKRAPVGEALPHSPAHWLRVRNKQLYQERVGVSEDGEGELLTVSHLTGVTPRSQKNVTMFEAESTVGYKLVEPGDLAINTMWAWMGALGVATTPGIASPSYGVYRPIGDLPYHPRYFDYLYRSAPYVAKMTVYSKGITESRLRLYPETFLRLPIVVPPLEEQRAIVDRIESETEQLDAAVTTAERGVELARERRAALISAAVTGKIDVGVAA